MVARQFSGLLLVAVLGAAPDAFALEQGNPRNQQDTRPQMRFRNMDTDNDGVVTRAEWRGNLQSFRQHDTNHDNVLSGPEVWGAQSSPAGGDSLRQVFDSADRNNDRLLARDEWYGDLQTFERIDRNNDGRISWAEFQGNEGVGTTGVEDTFESLDRNRNNVLTVSEWTGDRSEFDALDTDNDGVVTRLEYRQAQNRTPAFRAGYERGLTDGRQAGREDKNAGQWDLDGQRELEQADAGYNPSVGGRSEYQAGYRAGFRRGYAIGFGPR
jgi:Ca2+-binding EF-hand superfamily protein